MNPTARSSTGASTDRDAACSAVAAILWQQRELLDHLLYALSCQQFVLTSGGVRWVAASDAQVSAALDALTDCELHRAIETDRLARLMDLPADATLGAIAASCAPPWDTMLTEHRDGLTELVAEVAAVTAHNRRLLRAGAEIVRDTLDRVSEMHPAYFDTSTTRSLLFDRQV